ncbi:hypothetical protein DFP72DRAFT_801144, partial [Ephemerocybe angulata]
IRGIALFHGPGSAAYAWVKFGEVVYMSEARTQHFVAQLLNTTTDDAPVRVPLVYLAFEAKGYGFIVMEYAACTSQDAKRVGAAVQYLFGIQGPELRPGPVGGGIIGHRFFVDCESSVAYGSVQELENHVNGILRFAKHPYSVTFAPEVEAYGLRLCLSDMNENNFLKDEQGKIVAIDFEATSFLPICFMEMALSDADGFAWLVSQHVKVPKSGHLKVLQRASYILTPYSRNSIGK